MYVVYIHKFPNNKVYVGITGNRYPKKRWSCGNGYKTQQLMWRAIQKYGWDNIEHEIVAKNLTHEDACRLEIKLIKQYKSNNSDYGYNVSSGGDGANGIKLSKDRIEKLRAVNTGSPPPTLSTIPLIIFKRFVAASIIGSTLSYCLSIGRTMCVKNLVRSMVVMGLS